jgi:HPr kinase/phosphorylase
MNGMSVEALLRDDGKRLGISQAACRYGSENKIDRSDARQYEGEHAFHDDLQPEAISIFTPPCIGALKRACASTRRRVYRNIVRAGIPCIILSQSWRVPDFMIQFSDAYHIPVLASRYDGHLIESRLLMFLREKIEGTVVVHGALVKVNGVGVMITGESGTGKTVCAIKLTAGGHRWIADDVIKIVKGRGGILYGRSHESVRNRLAIRNVGIVNATDFFGEESVCEETVVGAVVKFETPDDRKGVPAYDSFDESYDIMGVKLPCMGLPAGSDRIEPAERIECATRKISTGGLVS